jgi:hypothetical protein
LRSSVTELRNKRVAVIARNRPSSRGDLKTSAGPTWV